MKKIDLHIHSNLSDGYQSPEELVKKSKSNGCSLISITDHEIIQDYTDLSEKYTIDILSGIEFNTATHNLHILGYGILNLEKINKEMTILKLKNEKICLKLIKLLNEFGYDISIKKLKDYLESINLNCDIIDKRKIVKYLIYKGYAKNTLDAYEKIIGVGTVFYIPNVKITSEEILDLINRSGGKAVLAHPNTINWNKDDIYNELLKLKECGLYGIEIYNKKMLLNDDFYIKYADDLDLIKTVGTDYHDGKTDNIGIDVEDGYLENIKRKLLLK